MGDGESSVIIVLPCFSWKQTLQQAKMAFFLIKIEENQRKDKYSLL
ncbi:hypothetical protein A33Q_4117 [Indibacter alkaliphilus LW1]|jgi:hypothetical protein|uniref:Uncharacterized protein n=1 Tax=Indibacter alkaliphilus (strain CCUG 57479 / KCTC 22604 / LW1) TaxID=1189612 RepID=S2CZI5_INDAL|nr:hypothetical protein A33Q_4117 [Indibacter alkaliphilus LW1]